MYIQITFKDRMVKLSQQHQILLDDQWRDIGEQGRICSLSFLLTSSSSSSHFPLLIEGSKDLL